MGSEDEGKPPQFQLPTWWLDVADAQKAFINEVNT